MEIYFIISHIWHDLLRRINNVNRIFQGKLMCIDEALRHLQGFVDVLCHFRNHNIKNCIDSAKKNCELSSEDKLSLQTKREVQ